MNEHFKKGEEAFARKDLKTAFDEYISAKRDPSSSPFIRGQIERRLTEIKNLTGSKTLKSSKIQTEWDRPEIGWLRYLGYHVGVEKGIPKNERRDILKKAFYLKIPREAEFSEEHVDWWGEAGSPKRFERLCSRLSTLGGKAEAVNDRTDDLLWLQSEFSRKVFHVNSP